MPRRDKIWNTMPSLSGYFGHTIQRMGTQIMEMLCDWHSNGTFHAGGVQTTCAISGVVDLQNLPGTTLVFESRLQLENQAASTKLLLLCIQSKSQTSTLTLSLPRRLPRRQSCPTLLATTLPNTRSSTFGMFRGVSRQSKLRKRGRNS